MSEKRVVSIDLDGGQPIWVEVEILPLESEKGPRQVSVFDRVEQRLEETVVSTIQGVSRLVLRSLSKLADEDRVPEKVSLEFAIKFVGEAAIPTIAKGSAESNLGVTIEWTLRDGDKS